MTRRVHASARRGLATRELLAGLALALLVVTSLDAALACGAALGWPDAAREAGQRFHRYRFANDWRQP